MVWNEIKLETVPYSTLLHFQTYFMYLSNINSGQKDNFLLVHINISKWTQGKNPEDEAVDEFEHVILEY